MVSKVFFNAPNDFAAEAKNINWGMQVFGGELTTKSSVVDEDKGGFPVRGRHVTLNGYYKFFPVGGDSLQISLDMKKGNTILGSAYNVYYDSIPDFTPFSIPIAYTDSSNIPDSATMDLRLHNASSLHIGSKFVIDKLSFDGFVSGVKNINPDLLEMDGMKVYPNPARDLLIIENLFADNKECSLTLFSVKGEIIREKKLSMQEHYTQMEVGDLAPGFYVLVMKKGDRAFSKKIIIQK